MHLSLTTDPTQMVVMWVTKGKKKTFITFQNFRSRIIHRQLRNSTKRLHSHPIRHYLYLHRWSRRYNHLSSHISINKSRMAWMDSHRNSHKPRSKHYLLLPMWCLQLLLFYRIFLHYGSSTLYSKYLYLCCNGRHGHSRTHG